MTRLLTIDTSGLVTQVALALDGVLLNQKKIHSKRASQSVLRLVSEVLRESNVSLRQVDAMCVVTHLQPRQKDYSAVDTDASTRRWRYFPVEMSS